MDDDDDGNGNEDAYVRIVEPSFSQMVILIMAMVRKRMGQMGISSSLGMCRRRSGGKGERREVLEWMLMRLMGRATRIRNCRHGCVSMPLLQGTSISLHPELPPLSLPLGSTASASSSARLQGVSSATHL